MKNDLKAKDPDTKQTVACYGLFWSKKQYGLCYGLFSMQSTSAAGTDGDERSRQKKTPTKAGVFLEL